MTVIWQTVWGVLVALGGGGAIVLGLSNWLGKVWAQRYMAREQARYDQELADHRAKHDRALEELRASLAARSEREIEELRTELEIFKTKILAAHQDKIGLYRMAVDVVTPMIAAFSGVMAIKGSKPDEYNSFARQFDAARLKAYGYLGMFAPQTVMDGFDSMIDLIQDAMDEEPPEPTWDDVRDRGLRMLNAIRVDLGLDPTPIAYRGRRQGNKRPM